MISDKYLELLKSEEFLKIDNTHRIVEKDRTNQFIMSLEVTNSKKNLYSLFSCKGKKGNMDYSRMTFLKNINFPDQVIMQVEDDKLFFHVIELKKSPINDLSKLERQFMGATLHIRALTGIWGILNYEIKYYVNFVNEDLPLSKKYSEVTKLIKGIPGEPPPPLDKKVANWFESKVEATLGIININEPIIKINVLETLEDNTYIRYLSEVSI